ncbi:uncharacterized protein LOC112197880 isoform X4 [Rosa chinensis]|uniref:uncharacterized protein LOC112197880 isoform X4 n=1 Tax=Rosa chinensis TaxID=74649 RepID=UPI001AD8BDE9|nr:uncharacterized protein LOC112197880 isoform X4 [Rosa chinensis]XP_040374890.1 uncharacterized protein LOC112197880 isoform X4 [Rosa chinensis]
MQSLIWHEDVVKIKDIGWRNGQLSCALFYYDFPDEKSKWEKIYQSNPADSKRTRKEKILMMRPPFPPMYNESKRPDVNTLSEVVVIVSDVWKVGDLVDWWKDDCYWSGKVAEVLGDEKVKVELPRPPVGEGVEGETYEASCNDLRASLNWSLKGGWTVPTSKVLMLSNQLEKKSSCCFFYTKLFGMPLRLQESENGHPCARVIKPDNQGDIANLMVQSFGDGSRDDQAIAGVKQPLTGKDTPAAETNMESDVADSGFERMRCPDTVSKLHVKDASNEMEATATRVDILDNKKPLKRKKTHVADSGFGKMSFSDGVSKLHVEDASNEMEATTTRVDILDNTKPVKRKKTHEDIVLNSMNSDTLEAALLDLEELVNRIKWMKGILEIGLPLTGAMRPRWKFLGDHSSSAPKHLFVDH